jgi:hypothetical protein
VARHEAAPVAQRSPQRIVPTGAERPVPGAVHVGRRRTALHPWRGPAIILRCDDDGGARLAEATATSPGNVPRCRRGGRGGASPLHRWAGTSPVRPIPPTVGPYPPSCRGQAVPDPPARRAGNPTPMAAAVPLPITVQAVGIERPGLKPRAEPASPLKGAVRRPGARVDRLGAGAVWDQPASAGLGSEPGRSRPGDRGYSRSADLRCVSCETCRPRGIAAPLARRARQRLAPTWGGWRISGGPSTCLGGTVQPRRVGVRRCLTRRPAAAGKPDRGRSSCRGRVIHTGTFAGVHVATLPGAAPVDRSRVFLAPRAHRPVPTASPCRLLTASPLGEPRRLSG